MNLFDTHAHYNDEQFDEDRETIIKETLESGVSNFVVAGYSLESSKKALNIAANYPEAYVIVGISPNDIEDIHNMEGVKKSVQALEIILTENKGNGKIVAIGEIGLDYHWNAENKELQKVAELLLQR